MERVTQMSSKVLMLALALAGCTPATAQINEATRSLYTARLADNAAGRFNGMAGSPLVGVANVPTLDTIVTWDRLRRENYTIAKGARFAEYAEFLRANPDWPQGTTVRRLAEKLIDDGVTAPERLAYFSQFPPLSALAKLRLAEAQLSLGRPAEARATARDAWDSAGLDSFAERQLLALFEKDLRAEDHLSRRPILDAARWVVPFKLPEEPDEGSAWLLREACVESHKRRLADAVEDGHGTGVA